MIACIWDYFGKDSKGTAEHIQSFVWCAGNKEDLSLIIELLKPKHYLNKENFNEFGIYI